MARKEWYAFDAHVDQNFTDVSENTEYEVIHRVWRHTLMTFGNRAEAEAYVRQDPRGRELLVNQTVTMNPVATGQAVAVVTPLPVFDRPFTHLATRGFWDTTLTLGNRTTTVATFSFGMVFLPVKSVYNIQETGYSFRDQSVYPDVLLENAGWHVYESFARIVGGSVQHDPPFYSKAKRKVSAHSALLVVLGFSVRAATQTNVNLTFGARFRMLIQV